MFKYLKEEGYIRLIQCFLQPGLMLQHPELSRSHSRVQGGEVSEHLPQQPPQAVDPIYQLFMSDQQGMCVKCLS